MGRVFKFRVWDKTSDEMLYQDDFSRFEIDFLNKMIYLHMPSFYLGSLDYEKGIEAEIMQCTGIKDINKKYIYEGDICKVKYCDIEGNPYDLALEREVKWSGAGFRLYERTNTGELSSSLTTRDIYSLEVIGNIYEGVKDGLS